VSAEASWEERGRSEKVAAIVAALDVCAESRGLDPLADAEHIARELRRLTPEQWHKVQQAAGYKRKTPPSSKTIAAVLDVYTRRVDLESEQDGAA
jgi:hypothetical protein